MYIPRHFKPSDELAHEFLSHIESGHLVTNTNKGLISTLLPLIFDIEKNTFFGHIAKINEQSTLPTNQEALLISVINETYISPTWYASKEEHHKVVPTWNYMLVHAYGLVKFHSDPEWLLNQVTQLTNRFESKMAKPWRVEQASEDYLEGQLKAITGVEINLTRIEVSFKMSQNKTKADFEGVVQGLEEIGNGKVAQVIKDLRPEGKS